MKHWQMVPLLAALLSISLFYLDKEGERTSSSHRGTNNEGIMPYSLSLSVVGNITASTSDPLLVSFVELPSLTYTVRQFVPQIPDCNTVARGDRLIIPGKHTFVRADICGNDGAFDPDLSLFDAIPSCRSVAQSEFIGACRIQNTLVDFCFDESTYGCSTLCSLSVAINTTGSLPAKINDTSPASSRFTSVAITPTNITRTKSALLLIRVKSPLYQSAGLLSYLLIASFSGVYQLQAPYAIAAPAIGTGETTIDIAVRVTSASTQNITLSSIQFEATHTASPWTITRIRLSECTDIAENVTIQLNQTSAVCTTTDINEIEDRVTCTTNTTGACCATSDALAAYTKDARLHLMDVSFGSNDDFLLLHVMSGSHSLPVAWMDDTHRFVRIVTNTTNFTFCGNQSFIIDIVYAPIVSGNCTSTETAAEYIAMNTTMTLDYFALFPEPIELNLATDTDNDHLYFQFQIRVDVHISPFVLPAICTAHWVADSLRPTPYSRFIPVDDETMPMYIAVGPSNVFLQGAHNGLWSMGEVFDNGTTAANTTASKIMRPATFYMDTARIELFIHSGAVGIPVSRNHATTRDAYISHIQCNQVLTPVTTQNFTDVRSTFRQWRMSTTIGNNTSYRRPTSVPTAVGKPAFATMAELSAVTPTANDMGENLQFKFTSPTFKIPCSLTVLADNNAHASFLLLNDEDQPKDPILWNFYFTFGFRDSRPIPRYYYQSCYTIDMTAAYEHTPRVSYSDGWRIPSLNAGSVNMLIDRLENSYGFPNSPEDVLLIRTEQMGGCPYDYGLCQLVFSEAINTYHAATKMPLLTTPVTVAEQWHSTSGRIVPFTNFLETDDYSIWPRAPQTDGDVAKYSGVEPTGRGTCYSSMYTCYFYSMLAYYGTPVGCQLP